MKNNQIAVWSEGYAVIANSAGTLLLTNGIGLPETLTISVAYALASIYACEYTVAPRGGQAAARPDATISVLFAITHSGEVLIFSKTDPTKIFDALGLIMELKISEFISKIKLPKREKISHMALNNTEIVFLTRSGNLFLNKSMGRMYSKARLDEDSSLCFLPLAPSIVDEKITSVAMSQYFLSILTQQGYIYTQISSMGRHFARWINETPIGDNWFYQDKNPSQKILALPDFRLLTLRNNNTIDVSNNRLELKVPSDLICVLDNEVYCFDSADNVMDSTITSIRGIKYIFLLIDQYDATRKTISRVLYKMKLLYIRLRVLADTTKSGQASKGCVFYQISLQEAREVSDKQVISFPPTINFNTLPDQLAVSSDTSFAMVVETQVVFKFASPSMRPSSMDYVDLPELPDLQGRVNSDWQIKVYMAQINGERGELLETLFILVNKQFLYAIGNVASFNLKVRQVPVNSKVGELPIWNVIIDEEAEDTVKVDRFTYPIRGFHVYRNLFLMRVGNNYYANAVLREKYPHLNFLGAGNNKLFFRLPFLPPHEIDRSKLPSPEGDLTLVATSDAKKSYRSEPKIHLAAGSIAALGRAGIFSYIPKIKTGTNFYRALVRDAGNFEDIVNVSAGEAFFLATHEAEGCSVLYSLENCSVTRIPGRIKALGVDPLNLPLYIDAQGDLYRVVQVDKPGSFASFGAPSSLYRFEKWLLDPPVGKRDYYYITNYENTTALTYTENNFLYVMMLSLVEGMKFQAITHIVTQLDSFKPSPSAPKTQLFEISPAIAAIYGSLVALMEDFVKLELPTSDGAAAAAVVHQPLHSAPRKTLKFKQRTEKSVRVALKDEDEDLFTL
jgi:hypothetical protein